MLVEVAMAVFNSLHGNTAETRRDTKSVGVFWAGATPDTGLLNLCGHVWEWRATFWSEGDAWDAEAGTDDAESVARRVVRLPLTVADY